MLQTEWIVKAIDAIDAIDTHLRKFPLYWRPNRVMNYYYLFMNNLICVPQAWSTQNRWRERAENERVRRERDANRMAERRSGGSGEWWWCKYKQRRNKSTNNGEKINIIASPALDRLQVNAMDEFNGLSNRTHSHPSVGDTLLQWVKVMTNDSVIWSHGNLNFIRLRTIWRHWPLIVDGDSHLLFSNSERNARLV